MTGTVVIHLIVSEVAILPFAYSLGIFDWDLRKSEGEKEDGDFPEFQDVPDSCHVCYIQKDPVSYECDENNESYERDESGERLG